MRIAFEVLTVVLVASTMGLALAHALEWPGKIRLDREQYLAVRPIYYPGFTIGGGVAEAGGMLATLTLLLMTSAGSAAFWLIAGTLAALIVILPDLPGGDPAGEQGLAAGDHARGAGQALLRHGPGGPDRPAAGDGRTPRPTLGVVARPPGCSGEPRPYPAGDGRSRLEGFRLGPPQP